jgi:hypothetical protein
MKFSRLVRRLGEGLDERREPRRFQNRIDAPARGVNPQGESPAPHESPS